MTRAKRRKPPRIDDSDDDDNDDNDDNDDEVVEKEITSPPPKKHKEKGNDNNYDDDDDNDDERKPAAKKKDDGRIDYDADYVVPASEIINHDVPFCCAKCKCPEEQKKRVVMLDEDGEKVPADEENNWVTTADNCHWHRRCCHLVFENQNNTKWAPQFNHAINKALEMLDDKEFQPKEFKVVARNTIKKLYKSSYAQLARHNNADGKPRPGYVSWKHENFPAAVKWFENIVQERKNNPSKKVAATVLDCFAGIGTAIVCLKKNNIKIGKVIHVEYDSIATHVYRHNHDHKYNDHIDNNGVKHIYIKTFEWVEKKFKKLVDNYGPIDIIVGGPPYIDFSPINAKCKGVQGLQGSYMVRFGKLIRKIEKHQCPSPLFFLAENVTTQGDDKVQIKEAFEQDWDPTKIDAASLSPCCRKREYYTNIPPYLNTDDFESEETLLSRSACIESGFKVPAQHIKPNLPAKIPCFMASKSCIDDHRMYVFKYNPLDKKYYSRPMNLTEREKLMGFPDDYIEIPVHLLFQEIRDNALALSVEKSDKQWQNELPMKYHRFKGHYHGCFRNQESFQVDVVQSKMLALRDGKNEVSLTDALGVKMAPPLGSHLRPSFFFASEYGKHLIGNAFSVPVVTALLKPLKDLFETKVYEDFTYQYTWQSEA